MLSNSDIIKSKATFKDNRLKRIIKNSGIILFGDSTASVLNIVSFTIMARELGPESLAILVLAQTYTLIVNDIFNIQTWESMVKFGSRNLSSNKISDVIKTNILLDIVGALVAFIFAISFIKTFVVILGWNKAVVDIASLYCFSIIFNITTFTIGVPRLFNKFFLIAKVHVTIALLKLILVIFAMYSSKDLNFYTSIYLISDIFNNVLLILCSVIILNKNFNMKWWKYRISIDKEQLRFVWWTNLRTIIRIPVRHFDIIVLSAIMPIKSVGIYKVYKEIAGLIGRIGDPINQSIYPEFTKLLGKSDVNGTAHIAKKIIFFLLGVSFLITLFLLLGSEILVNRFFGSEYLVQIYALYAMIVLYGVKLVTSPINSLFIASGFAKYSFLIVIVTNTIYLISVFYLGKKFEIYGIIAAIAIQSFLNTGLKMTLLKRFAGNWDKIVR